MGALRSVDEGAVAPPRASSEPSLSNFEGSIAYSHTRPTSCAECSRACPSTDDDIEQCDNFCPEHNDYQQHNSRKLSSSGAEIAPSSCPMLVFCEASAGACPCGEGNTKRKYSVPVVVTERAPTEYTANDYDEMALYIQRNGERVFSEEEIRRHDSAYDCWITARGCVYDVTRFLADHPGGPQSILKKAGGAADATADFFFHSRRGQRMWAAYKIGEVANRKRRYRDTYRSGASICSVQ